jgi:DNA-binding NtrC family response regulator
MKERFDGLVDQMLTANIFLEQAIEILETAMIQRMMEITGGNQSEASKRLGIHRNTLQRKLAQYGISNGRARRKPLSRQSRSGKTKRDVA